MVSSLLITTKMGRDNAVGSAHSDCGYALQEIAGFMKIHYTTARKVVAWVSEGRK